MVAHITVPPTVPATASRPVDSAALPPPVAATPSPAVTATLQPVPAKTNAGETVGQANPTFQFDPAAGVLVIQFRDDSGKVALSIPSQQQIQAYATDRVEGQKPSSNTVIA